jgi:hypothetical protein
VGLDDGLHKGVGGDGAEPHESHQILETGF